MFLIGLISLLQYVAPGYIITHFFPQRGIQRIINSVLLSLFVNFYQVWLLTALKLYTTTFCWTVLSVEVLACIYLGFKETKVSDTSLSFIEWFKQQSTHERGWWLFWSGCLVLFGGLCLLSAVSALKGTVFGGWDAALSWNRWAIDWYAGGFPAEAYHYPQVFPANYSLNYVLLGTVDIEFFAHSLTFFFPLAILSFFVSLAIQELNYQYIAAAAITAFLIYINEGHHLGVGLIDIPITCMGFAAVICLYQAKEQKTLLLGMLLAATACLTKQMGILFFVIYPLLAIWLRKCTLKQASLLLGAGLCLIAPWYLWTEYLIMIGENQSEVGHLFVDIHEGRNLFERFTLSMKTLFRKPNLAKALKLSPMSSHILFTSEIIATLILFIYSLKDRFLRGIGLSLTLPIFLLWTLVYNYDFRNLDACLPLAGWAFAYSLVTLPKDIISIFTATLERIIDYKKPLAISLVTLMLALTAYTTIKWSTERLALSQIEQKKQLGIPSLNQKLYRYTEEHGMQGGVLSDYRYVWLLPGIKEHFRYIPYSYYPLDSWVKIDLLQKKYNDIAYIIVPSQAFARDDFAAEFNNRKQQGKATEIWEADGFVLFQTQD